MALLNLFRSARSLSLPVVTNTLTAVGLAISPGIPVGVVAASAGSVSCAAPDSVVLPGSDRASWPQTRVAGTFAGMAHASAARLAETHPAQVADLDGAPPALRYAANARLAGPAYAGRQLLLFDPTGTGRFVEVLGDLGTARRIAVLVPGVDSRLVDFDRGLGDVQRRAPGWQARQLRAVASADVAVVAWLGWSGPGRRRPSGLAGCRT